MLQQFLSLVVFFKIELLLSSFEIEYCKTSNTNSHPLLCLKHVIKFSSVQYIINITNIILLKLPTVIIDAFLAEERSKSYKYPDLADICCFNTSHPFRLSSTDVLHSKILQYAK